MCGNVDSPWYLLSEFGERSPCAAWAAFFMLNYFNNPRIETISVRIATNNESVSYSVMALTSPNGESRLINCLGNIIS